MQTSEAMDRMTSLVAAAGPILAAEGPATGASVWHRDLAVVLRRYGFFALDPDQGSGSTTPRLRIVNPAFEVSGTSESGFSAYFIERSGNCEGLGLDCRTEPAGQMLYAFKTRWLQRPVPAFRPLLDHVSFAGKDITPLWQTRDGRTVVGWWKRNGTRSLLVGLRVAEELVRYTQGDRARTGYEGNRNLWGRGHEQASFLYEGHVVRGHELVPWADRLGALLTGLLAQVTGIPLFAPLPDAARGCVLLTGDDDQAWLEKYAEQLELIGDFPISYMMLPHTNHTRETIAKLPPNVEFGIHVDALEHPGSYDDICARQSAAVRELLGGRPAHTIRNHGHLNRNYWEHLPAWEAAGLTLGLNIRGLDGTCPTGSYLPFRVRRADGSWSTQTTVFSTFSDSMLFMQKWPEARQIKVIQGLARQIEQTYPGILVCNFHPQNVSSVRNVHKAVVEIGRTRGWHATGVESLRGWIETLDGVRMTERDCRFVLASKQPVSKLALSWPSGTGWTVLPDWQGEQAIPT